MRPSIEIGYCDQLPTPSTTTTTTTASSTTTTTTTTATITYTMVKKCTSNSDCKKGFICGKGECFPGCNSNDDCFDWNECIKPLPNAIVGECKEIIKTSPKPISTPPTAMPFPIVTQEADLELCILPTWNANSRSPDNVIFNVNIVDCKPDEICEPAPETAIYGIKLGRCKPVQIYPYED